MKSKYNDTNFENLLKEEIDSIQNLPMFHCRFFTIFIEKQFKFNTEVMRTEPYEKDGNIPLIILELGPFQIMFENFRIYKYVYEKTYGWKLDE